MMLRTDALRLPRIFSRRRRIGVIGLYRAGDLLLERQREIEQHLRERQRSLFNLERTVLLYDLTNTWSTTDGS